MSAPSVYAYLDHRAYLTDWFAHQKRESPGYSYAAFAASGGGSKSALANVLSGARKPRPATLDAFARAMTLAPAERNYLGLLVDLDAAPDLSARRDVMERILTSDRHLQVREANEEPAVDVFRYVEHWYIPAIRELAALSGFREDPAWIAQTLRPSIHPEQAQQALDTLFELDFLRRAPDGSVEVQEVRFRTNHEAQQDAAAYVHRHVVPEMLQRLDTSASDEQHLLTATMTLSPDQLPEFKARLNAILDQLVNMADDRGAPPHAVYQLAVQLLPLSEHVE